MYRVARQYFRGEEVPRMDFECSARQVPTWRISANIEQKEVPSTIPRINEYGCMYCAAVLNIFNISLHNTITV